MNLYINGALSESLTEAKILKNWQQNGLPMDSNDRPYLIIDFLEKDVISKVNPETKLVQEQQPNARMIKLMGKTSTGEIVHCADSVTRDPRNTGIVDYHPSLYSLPSRTCIKDANLAYFMAFLSPNVEGNYLDDRFKGKPLFRIIDEQAGAKETVAQQISINKLGQYVYIQTGAKQESVDALMLLGNALGLKGLKEMTIEMVSQKVAAALHPITAVKARKYLGLLESTNKMLSMQAKINELEEYGLIRISKNATEWTINYLKDGVPVEQVTENISLGYDPREVFVERCLRDDVLRQTLTNRLETFNTMNTQYPEDVETDTDEVVPPGGPLVERTVEEEAKLEVETLEAMSLDDLRDTYMRLANTSSIPNIYKNNKDGSLVGAIMKLSSKIDS